VVLLRARPAARLQPRLPLCQFGLAPV